jgi:hypothetical protein
MLREVAVNGGFVDKQNNGSGFNPLGPHALRENFGSLMINSGVPDTIVDFCLSTRLRRWLKPTKESNMKA